MTGDEPAEYLDPAMMQRLRVGSSDHEALAYFIEKYRRLRSVADARALSLETERKAARQHEDRYWREVEDVQCLERQISLLTKGLPKTVTGLKGAYKRLAKAALVATGDPVAVCACLAAATHPVDCEAQDACFDRLLQAMLAAITPTTDPALTDSRSASHSP